MNLEIERKFLVRDGWEEAVEASANICQGYIAHDRGRTVRVRTRDDRAYLTIKGPSDESGISRMEWEKEISREDAVMLMAFCPGGFINKTRHLATFGGHTFEIDEFHGDNEGLVVAEIELGSVDEIFEKPSWLGEEVTGDGRYYNSSLLSHPWKSWKK